MTKTPLFLTVPEALHWAAHPKWDKLLLADTALDAQRFISQMAKESVPIWLVENRCSYKSSIPWLADYMWAKGLGIAVQKHEPLASWEAGKWQLGFDCYVGGTRFADYGNKKFEMMKAGDGERVLKEMVSGK